MPRTKDRPSTEETILCRNPDPAKQGTRISQWRYDTVRKAILKAVGRGRAGVEFKQLTRLVADSLSAADRARLGSVPWYAVTVKLDLESSGELERIPGAKPHRVRRA
jgi:hypothetical protein